MSCSTHFIQNTLGVALYQQVIQSNRDSVQGLLQSELRKRAIEHLKTANTPLARGFRAEYGSTGGVLNASSWEGYLNKQSRNGVWGSYIELAALGELFNVDVTVSSINDKRYEAEPFCVHRASSDTDIRPLVHLYNQSNVHWFVPPGTRGDGNCLYNAFAQSLYAALKPEVALEPKAVAPAASTLLIPETVKSDSKASLSKPPAFFNTGAEKQAEKEKATQLQKSILQAIALQRTPEQMVEDFNAEKQRIQKLSPEEQQQIADDHRFALEIAMEEVSDSREKQTDRTAILRCLLPKESYRAASKPMAAASA